MITGNEPCEPMMNVGFEVKADDIAIFPDRADFKVNYKGLTIRQEFAARAMQGLLSNSTTSEVKVSAPEKIAKAALIFADALIAELNKTEKP